MNAGLPFVRTLLEEPEGLAIVQSERSQIRRGELASQVLAFAAHLCQRGVGAGDRILVQVPNGIAFATVTLGAMLVGAVPVLLEPGLGDAVYQDRVRAVQPRLVVEYHLLRWIRRVPGSAGMLRRLELDLPPAVDTGEPSIVVSPRSMARLRPPPGGLEGFEVAQRSATDDAVLVFTGGTSDLPKCVRVGVAGLEAFLANIFDAIDGLAGAAFLADTPPQLLYGLRKGQTVHVAKGRKQARARHVRDALQAGEVDAYFGSPYVWTEMARLPGSSKMPPSVRAVLLGSAPATPGFLHTLQSWLDPATRVRVLYGMTEVGLISSVDASTKVRYRGVGDLVGAPLPGVRIAWTDVDPDTGVGELVVHSDALFLGYLGQPARRVGDGLRTGDLGVEVEVDGVVMIALMGRKKDMIIRNSVNIYPLSFESHLKRSLVDADGTYVVAECAMVGVWNADREDEDVVLALQPAPGQPLDLNRLRPRIDAVCGTDAKPDRVVVMPHLPVTGRQNKVDKRALGELLRVA